MGDFVGDLFLDVFGEVGDLVEGVDVTAIENALYASFKGFVIEHFGFDDFLKGSGVAVDCEERVVFDDTGEAPAKGEEFYGEKACECDGSGDEADFEVLLACEECDNESNDEAKRYGKVAEREA